MQKKLGDATGIRAVRAHGAEMLLGRYNVPRRHPPRIVASEFFDDERTAVLCFLDVSAAAAGAEIPAAVAAVMRRDTSEADAALAHARKTIEEGFVRWAIQVEAASESVAKFRQEPPRTAIGALDLARDLSTLWECDWPDFPRKSVARVGDALVWEMFGVQPWGPVPRVTLERFGARGPFRVAVMGVPEDLHLTEHRDLASRHARRIDVLRWRGHAAGTPPKRVTRSR